MNRGEVARYAGHADAVLSVAFAPGGGRVVSGARDGGVALWNAGTGAVALALQKQGKPVRSVMADCVL